MINEICKENPLTIGFMICLITTIIILLLQWIKNIIKYHIDLFSDMRKIGIKKYFQITQSGSRLYTNELKTNPEIFFLYTRVLMLLVTPIIMTLIGYLIKLIIC